MISLAGLTHHELLFLHITLGMQVFPRDASAAFVAMREAVRIEMVARYDEWEATERPVYTSFGIDFAHEGDEPPFAVALGYRVIDDIPF